MKNRISFCVNACKKTTFRFIGGLQNVLRFLEKSNTFSPECKFIIRNKMFHHLKPTVSPFGTEGFMP